MHAECMISGVPEERLELKSLIFVCDECSAFSELTLNLISYSFTHRHTTYAFHKSDCICITCMHASCLSASLKTINITHFVVQYSKIMFIILHEYCLGYYQKDSPCSPCSADQEFELHFSLRAKNHISYLQIKLFTDMSIYNIIPPRRYVPCHFFK